MAWDLRGNYDDEIDARPALGVGRTSPAQVDELYPALPLRTGTRRSCPRADLAEQRSTDATPTTAPSTSPADGRRARHGERRRAALDAVPRPGRPTASGIGSNSWVVSGAHTTTGKPLLANDPHLGTVHARHLVPDGAALHARVDAACPFDVAGFTFAGLPGVVIGHNRRRSPGASPTSTRTSPTSTWRRSPATRTSTTASSVAAGGRATRMIKVGRGEAGDDHRPRDAARSARLRRRTTSSPASGGHAPAPAGLARPRGTGYDVALRLDRADARAAPRTRSSRSTRRRTGTSSGPPHALRRPVAEHRLRRHRRQHRLPGARPDPDPQGRRDGDWPAPGWLPRTTGRATSRSTRCRSVLNPPDGYHRHREPGGHRRRRLPYFLDRLLGLRLPQPADPRPARCSQQGGQRRAPPTWRRIQLDTRNAVRPDARAVPAATAQPSPRTTRHGQRLLQDWDFHQPADSAAAAYFNAVWSNLLAAHLRRPAPRRGRPDGGDRWFAVVQQPAAASPNSLVGRRRPPAGRGRDEILPEAMVDARDELTTQDLGSPTKWQWGKLHQLPPGEPDARPGGLGLVAGCSTAGREVGGGSAIVDATGWDAASGLRRRPRAVDADGGRPADLDRSRWVNLTGASGHAQPRTTTTRPTAVGRRADGWRGPSGATRSRRPRTGWCWSRGRLRSRIALAAREGHPDGG